MADILDAANSQSDTPANTPNAAVPPLPVDENPIMVPAITPLAETPVPDTLIKEDATTPPHPLSDPPNPITPKKKLSKGIVLTIILLLLVTLPLMVFYVSQQRQIADSRSRAGNLPPPGPYTLDKENVMSGSCPTVKRECNTGGSVNVCSDGTWHSEPANPGECGATIHIPQMDIEQWKPICFADYVLHNHKASDASNYCNQQAQELQNLGYVLPNIQLPTVNPKTVLFPGIAMVQYGSCLLDGVNISHQSPTEAHNACQHYISDPQVNLPDVNIPPGALPGLNELGKAEYLSCMGTAMDPKQYDMNIENASAGCKRLLTDPECDSCKNIPPLLADAKNTACVLGALITNREITKEQAQKGCSGTVSQPPFCEERVEAGCANKGGCEPTSTGGKCKGTTDLPGPSIAPVTPTSSPNNPTSTPQPKLALGEPCDSFSRCLSGACKKQGGEFVCSDNTYVPKGLGYTGPPAPTSAPEPLPGSSQPGQCATGGGFTHDYNECCGPGLSKHVSRSCQGGQFTWATSDCTQTDPACGTQQTTSTCDKNRVLKNGVCGCADGWVWADGVCNNIQGCKPTCTEDSVCGANDGCSGICTNRCKSQKEANEASNKGPGAGLVNKGKGIKCVKGVCNDTNGELWQCTCDTLLNNASLVGYCDQKCTKISGTADCQSIANAQCKAIQLDVYDTSASHTLIDVTSCSPNVSCSSSNPPGGGGGGGGTGGGGGGGGTNPTTPPGTGTPPPPQCVSIKIYKNGTVVNPSTLQVGDQVQIAVAKNSATQAQVRINGGAWSQTTTLNSNNEYTVDWTVPQGLTNFTVESQIYVNGSWL